MDGNQYKLDAVQRCVDYLTAHRTELGPVPDSKVAQQIRVTLEEIRVAYAERERYRQVRQGMTGKIEAVTIELRDRQMKPLWQFADVRLKGAPGVASVSVRKRENLRGRKLVAKAVAMADVAAPYLTELVAVGFPSDVIDVLRATAKTLDALISERANENVESVARTKGVQDKLRAVRDAIRMLDASVVRQIGGNTQLLRGWRIAKRVTLKPGNASLLPRGRVAG